MKLKIDSIIIQIKINLKYKMKIINKTNFNYNLLPQINQSHKLNKPHHKHNLNSYFNKPPLNIK